MSLFYTVGYKWVTVMVGVKLDFNDIMSLCTKNDSRWRRFVCLGYFKRGILIYYIIIVSKKK